MGFFCSAILYLLAKKIFLPFHLITELALQRQILPALSNTSLTRNSPNQSDFCCPTNFCKHPTNGHHIAQNRTERQENLNLKNWTDSLAKSVGHNKNQKRHCSCKRGVSQLVLFFFRKLSSQQPSSAKTCWWALNWCHFDPFCYFLQCN